MSDAFEDWAAATFVKWRNSDTIQRKGQFYFNELYYVRPDIADQVIDTAADPFAHPIDEAERLAFFLDIVQGLWDKEDDNA